ncbi:MAG: LLM class flavin-dependent oxidoreductase [Actinobacteria bacterium]|nr:LLM class flavin-dependent oxidoreductase [Actinomycetota bacterium]
MRFDYMFSVWREGPSRPYREVLEEVREQAVLAEQASFDGLQIQEHHFDGEGFDVSPNPVLLGADLAARTSRIRLGMGAISLPLWHPLRVAEDLALLDNFSGGRVDVAFGRGLMARELMTLNPYADRRNKERSFSLYRESINLLRSAWTEEALRWDGEHFTFPPAGIKDHAASWYPRNPAWRSEDGEQVALAVMPHPVQKPHPPLWAVTESEDGMTAAAELGIGAHTWLPCGRRLTNLLTHYRDARRANGDADAELGDGVGLLRVVLVADSEQEARQAVGGLVDMLAKFIGGLRGKAAFADEGESLDGADDIPWVDFLVERDHLLIGTPETVAEQILRLREQHGIEHFLCWSAGYGVSHKSVMRSIELFGEQVLPLLHKELALPAEQR